MAQSVYKRKIRFRMWIKNPTCYVCKTEIKHFQDATTEHILPRCFGGTNNQRNLSISHRRCNNQRGNIFCPVILSQKLNTGHLTIKIQASECAKSKDKFKESVKAWKIKLRQDYLDWISSNTIQEYE